MLANTRRLPKMRVMRIRYIEIVYGVLQCGTVKGAADMLHITQPAATRLLQQAERHVGFTLFQRVRGRLVPTAEAKALFPQIERLYGELDGIRRMVGNLRDGQDSLVRVLCVPSLAVDYLPQAVAALRRKFKQAHVSIGTLHSREIGAALVLREADVGFTFDSPDHPALTTQPLASGPAMAVGLAGALAKASASVSLKQLAQLPVIDLDDDDPVGRPLHRALAVNDLAMQAAVSVRSYHAALALARLGMGVTVVDPFSAHAALGPSSPLRAVPLEPAMPVTVHAVRVASNAGSQMVEYLTQAMQATLAGARPLQAPR
jgi:DNA-binding transcriptional LysR family regulator